MRQALPGEAGEAGEAELLPEHQRAQCCPGNTMHGFGIFGAGVMVQEVKCLPQKHEGLSLDH